MSTPTVSFGFTLPQRGILFGVTTVPALMASATEADSSGLFDSIWVGDSLFAKPRPNSLALLGALTALTKKVTIGVGCMASFPIRDPIVMAYEWASLDLFSQGRMLLAVCTGIVRGGPSSREGAHWGVADRDRAALMEENIKVCRKLWSGDNVSFTGPTRSFEDVTITPKPVQQPCPIWIASNPGRDLPQQSIIDRSMRRVARMADGWMTTQLTPKAFAKNWTHLSAALTQEGRDPAAFPNVEYHNINLNPDRQAGLEESKRFLDHYYGPVFSPAMVETWTAAGTAEQCIEHLRELARDGAKQITLRVTSWDQAEQYKRLVGQVLPYVNDAL